MGFTNFIECHRQIDSKERDVCKMNGRLQILHRLSSSLLGPVDPSFRALSGRLQIAVRRHKFNQDYISLGEIDIHDLLRNKSEGTPVSFSTGVPRS